MKIREIENNDLERWSEMRTSLWPKTDDAHLAEIKAFFDGISIDVEQVYVAIIDETAVGFIELNIREFAEGSRRPKVPYVEAWYVDSEYRGRGYGKQLMLRAEKWAIDQGFNELASDTEIDNHISIAMHTHLGFKETERVVCFLKQLTT
ncbi:MAG: aminoglycoside 6'-N-acetyltransferase [Candidatus Thiodiazotropha sp.]